MASIGTLAAGAAHEINNPLAAIAANLTLILEELAVLQLTLPPEQLADLTQMATDSRTAAETIGNVIRGLKTFSRAADEQRSVIDVRNVLELSVSLTSHQISQRACLVTNYGATPLILADGARLGQVVVNLLVNAGQAIPEGDVSAHEIRISTSTDGAGRAVIEIRDTGSGIPAASLGQVFDPFFTTKKIGVGTGLGLSICHNLVSAIGGSISVTSEAPGGTTFRVEIPAADGIPVDGDARSVIAVPSAVSVSVLIVDDDPLVGNTIRRALRDYTVTVETAAAAALMRLDAGEKYDVILSDMMMPEMSGMDFHAELVRRHPEDAARVVFISGGTFTAGTTAFLAQVPNERLEKPFELDSLRALVRRFASKCSQERAAST
jgi:CheY-like chemotaxis protein/two-component sensor histidine kinase